MDNMENSTNFLEFYFTFRSITYAQRAQAILEGADVVCLLARTPKVMEERGCGYCLRVKSGRERAVELLDQRAIPFIRVYGKKADGTFQEVAL